MNPETDKNQQETLSSYDLMWRRRIESQKRPTWVRNLLRLAVDDLDKSATIFEIGSGTGDDALYLQDLGYKVEASDAVSVAVDYLKDRGLNARKFDILKDELPADYDLILALNVLHHFNVRQGQTAVDKIFQALSAGGRFVFSTHEGDGEDWKTKDGQSFYYHFWSRPVLRQILQEAGFEAIDISPNMNCDKGDYQCSWLTVIARSSAK